VAEACPGEGDHAGGALSTVRGDAYPRSMLEERLVHFRPRTVLVVLGIIIAAFLLLQIVRAAQGILIWIFVAIFFALALNPAVDALQRRGVRRRGVAVSIVFVGAILAIAALAATVVPTIVSQVNDFIDTVPEYVSDLTAGKGRLGFLEREYQITERVRDALAEGGATKVLGLSGTALAVTKGVITAVLATVTIAFLTLFMLLEGPTWMERLYRLLPEEKQPRWRAIGHEIYRTIGGYVTGNLAISLIAGIVSTTALLILGVPYAVALGLLVAILDLIPLAGATIAAILVTTVAFLDSTTSGIIMLIFFVVYQQLENHVLQPVVYGRTVQLSPLAVLIAVLIGAELAGVIGALAAIPVAGAIQVILVDWLTHRRARGSPDPTPTTV
jgi:predicted PurR-regulated permease PerM